MNQNVGLQSLVPSTNQGMASPNAPMSSGQAGLQNAMTKVDPNGQAYSRLQSILQRRQSTMPTRENIGGPGWLQSWLQNRQEAGGRDIRNTDWSRVGRAGIGLVDPNGAMSANSPTGRILGAALPGPLGYGVGLTGLAQRLGYWGVNDTFGTGAFAPPGTPVHQAYRAAQMEADRRSPGGAGRDVGGYGARGRELGPAGRMGGPMGGYA